MNRSWRVNWDKEMHLSSLVSRGIEAAPEETVFNQSINQSTESRRGKETSQDKWIFRLNVGPWGRGSLFGMNREVLLLKETHMVRSEGAEPILRFWGSSRPQHFADEFLFRDLFTHLDFFLVLPDSGDRLIFTKCRCFDVFGRGC